MRSVSFVRCLTKQKLNVRSGICLILSVLWLFVLCSPVLSGPLYRFQDEDGVVSYTDDPSDPRFKYVRVQSYETEQKEDVKESAAGAAPEKQGKESMASKNLLSPEDAAEKDRMLKKVAELEGIQSSTDHEKYKEMLQSEIDLLKKQLAEIDQRSGGKEAVREKAP